MSNQLLFGSHTSDLIADPIAPEIPPTEVPMLMDMTQQEFGMQMAKLISLVIDIKEAAEDQAEEDTFVLGGGQSSGGTPVDAILMG